MQLRKLSILGVAVTMAFAIALAEDEVVKGPIVDKVYFDVRMDESIMLMDVAAGTVDVAMTNVPPSLILGLDPATLEKLDLYIMPATTYSLNINPIPNEPPYIWEVGGKEHFNPLAIKEIRFALNWLINRQYIVDEILMGAGGPMYCMATPGQPGTDPYNLLALRMGLTPEGDEARALAEIDAAMTEAAQLPELQGRLEKVEDKWLFDGGPIVLKFAIRVDDPEMRLKEGEYIASQLEKAGFQVERLLWDRVKCSNTVYGGDPADYEWHLYTEGWGAGATRKFWHHIVAQMHAPWFGYMPGGQIAGYWQYENEASKRIDELTEKLYTGNFLTEEEYWDMTLEALGLGLDEALRLYICYEDAYFIANKERFVERMAYGLGDGLNEWSIITADVKPDPKTGEKVLRVTQFSALGGLFMEELDPVGRMGFGCVYSSNVGHPCRSRNVFESPASAEYTAWDAVLLHWDTQVDRDPDTGEVIGLIEVPPTAINYDPVQNKWVEVGPGVTAFTSGICDYVWPNWHHGYPITNVDQLYAHAFAMEWAHEDEPGDPFYDESYGAQLRPTLATTKGIVINRGGTTTTYIDDHFPPDPVRAGFGTSLGVAVTARVGNPAVPWEIAEALGLMVAEGSASGTVYGFSAKPGVTEVDLLRPSCVADIRAKLVEMKEKQYVPVCIADYITVGEAIARYDSAINWIDTYGHAFISNGFFYVSKFDPVANYVELSANRDPDFPFEVGYWNEFFKTLRLAIDEVEAPLLGARGEEIPVTVMVSEILYPIDVAEPATRGAVTVTLVTPVEELAFAAEYMEPGVFQAIIPAEVTAELEPGFYTILATAELAGAVPASGSTTTVVQ